MSDDIFASDEDVVKSASSSSLTRRGRRSVLGDIERENKAKKKEVSLTPRRVKLIKEVHSCFEKHFYMTKKDLDLLDVALAGVLDRDLPGDPLWMYIIAPSGGMKTELLRSLSLYPRVYTLSSLTTKTFVSGKWVTVPGSKTKDNPKGKQVLAGILYKLDGRVLVFKDFTVILGMRDKERYEIFAQFRDIYDGYHEKGFGTLNFKVSVKATIGCILGVTPEIDKHSKCHSIMGERFLKVRSHPDSKETTKRAHENLFKMKEIRAEVQEVVFGFLSGLSFDDLLESAEEQQQGIQKMARYIALMRAWVYASTWRGKVTNMTLPEPEVPTRVVMQLGKLAIGLALVRRHKKVTEDDMKTLRRVARDTALPLRQLIINTMVKDEKIFAERDAKDKVFENGDKPEFKEFTYYAVSQSSGAHYNSIRIEVDKMVALGILEAETEVTEKGEVNIIKFGFHEDFRELADEVVKKSLHGNKKKGWWIE